MTWVRWQGLKAVQICTLNNSKLKKPSLLLALLTAGIMAQAQHAHEGSNCAHNMAPVGIMGGHTHEKGHLMASYRYMLMTMDGTSSQGKGLSTKQVLQKYMMSPDNMGMQMHMLGVMYAIHDRVTLTAMGHFQKNTMEMTSYSGHHSESHQHSTHTQVTNQDREHHRMQSSGLGDMRLGALVRLSKNTQRCFHASAGLQLPTGNAQIKDGTSRMTYPMQTGTGSLAAYGGLNFSWLMPSYMIGAQATAVSPLHANSIGYRKSNKYETSIWGTRKIFHWMAGNVRVHGLAQSEIRGHDPHLNPMMSPSSGSPNAALGYVETLAGLNFKPAGNLRAAIEAGIPVYQWNRGIHLDHQFALVAGLQISLP